MRHFDTSVCCRENTEGFLDSHFVGDNFEQKSVATELIILLLLGVALPLKRAKQSLLNFTERSIKIRSVSAQNFGSEEQDHCHNQLS